MSYLALSLVISSALIHPIWNFLLKRGRNHNIFIWLAAICSGIFFIPLGIALYPQHPGNLSGWVYITGTIILHALYFTLLGRSYSKANLSFVYPIVRGSGAALVPILGVIIFGELVSLGAVFGILAIVVGIYTIYLWGRVSYIFYNPVRMLNDPGNISAILTGLTTAAYTLWDKAGVAHVTPLLYMYFMFLGTGLLLSPYMVFRHGVQAILRELKLNKLSILAVGILMCVSYGFVLSALQLSKVSYIAPVREVGIVIGVLLGSLFLEESYTTGRIIGSLLIVLGVVLISVSP